MTRQQDGEPVTHGTDPAGTDRVDPAPGIDPASLGRRFGALIIDWVLCLLVGGMIADPVRAGWLPVLVLILEYGFFLGLFAQTPGMFLTRIACVSHRDGGRIGIPRALLRGLLLALLVPALIMDDQRRGLHDRWSGSIVIPVTPRSAG